MTPCRARTDATFDQVVMLVNPEQDVRRSPLGLAGTPWFGSNRSTRWPCFAVSICGNRPTLRDKRVAVSDGHRNDIADLKPRHVYAVNKIRKLPCDLDLHHRHGRFSRDHNLMCCIPLRLRWARHV